MLEFLFQLLAIYLFAATPWFAGWIANGGKWEDVGIPILGSIFLASYINTHDLLFCLNPKPPSKLIVIAFL